LHYIQDTDSTGFKTKTNARKHTHLHRKFNLKFNLILVRVLAVNIFNNPQAMQQVKQTCTPDDGTAVPKCTVEQYKIVVLTEICSQILHEHSKANIHQLCNVPKDTFKNTQVLSE
jgi:hypothetical protein